MAKKQKLSGHLQALMGTHRAAFRFILYFILLLSLCFSIFYLFEDSFHIFRVWTAESTGFLSELLGMTVTVSDTQLYLETVTFEIIQECTGLFAAMIYLSCVLAYPAPWQQKTTGLLLGIPSIFGINLIRMLILVYIGGAHPDIFDYVHSFLWQGIFIIIVIFIFLVWIDKIVYHDTTTGQEKNT
jgi:archaeosortase B (VPXXXP-CTERM-specific)